DLADDRPQGLGLQVQVHGPHRRACPSAWRPPCRDQLHEQLCNEGAGTGRGFCFTEVHKMNCVIFVIRGFYQVFATSGAERDCCCARSRFVIAVTHDSFLNSAQRWASVMTCESFFGARLSPNRLRAPARMTANLSPLTYPMKQYS